MAVSLHRPTAITPFKMCTQSYMYFLVNHLRTGSSYHLSQP